jgi:hypothetical protein
VQRLCDSTIVEIMRLMLIFYSALWLLKNVCFVQFIALGSDVLCFLTVQTTDMTYF